MKLKKRMNPIYNNPIINNINLSHIRFRSYPPEYTEYFNAHKDSFDTNPIYQSLSDKNALTNSVKSNPEIMRILKENKLPVKINHQELEKLMRGHLMDTRIRAAKIYSALPTELKSEINLSDLQQAAMLHDYGKVLIPEKILNKNGQLTDEEKKIMNLHSELGYELLKGVNKGVNGGVNGGVNIGAQVNNNVLNLIKYHHQTPDGKGYPEITNNYKPDISSEILMAADKYSALREKRSYKEAMTHDEALNVMRQDVEAGLISPTVYKALEKIT